MAGNDPEVLILRCVQQLSQGKFGNFRLACSHNFLEENKLKPSLFSECCDTALLERKGRAVTMSPHGLFGAEWAPIWSGEGALRIILQLDEGFSG